MMLLLLVDDDEDIRTIYGGVLRDEGYDVLEAENGQCGLDLLHDGARPALILLDFAMPVMNGADFRIAQLSDPLISEIPVLLMTASAKLDCDELVARLRPCAVARKPIGLEPLLALVRGSVVAHVA